VKLIVQIPCLNEAATITETVQDIPRIIDGIDVVEVLVIDDGSRDDTGRIALNAGVDHVIRHFNNRGLAAAFSSGLEAAVQLGADIIVNTDGDNQYSAKDIPLLIRPILEKQADVVIGDRRTWTIQHFSFTKRCLQWCGSRIISCFSGADLPDAVSGFRAFSRDAAIRLNLVNSFSHTIETIIQCRHKHLAVVSVPVQTNQKTRPSRLFKNTPSFIFRSAAILLRTYAMYSPLRVFWATSIPIFVLGILAIARFLYFYASGQGNGHVQSVVLGGACVLLGCVVALAGVLADLISINRQIMEEMLERLRRADAKPDFSNNSCVQADTEFYRTRVANVRQSTSVN
jgi:glycosyltransferase involved in cell wall biosynthesis